MSKRVQMLESAILRAASNILQFELNDSSLGFVTITRVKLSPDTKYATLYISSLGSREEAEKNLEILKSSIGFIRGKIGKKVKMRSVPTIALVLDDTATKAERIETLLREINTENDSPTKD